MWNATRKMAEAIADGMHAADPSAAIKLFNTSKTDKTDVITDVFRSKAVILGSSTMANGYLYSIAGILDLMRGMKFKNKKAAAFGSYGWSGEAVANLTERLKQLRMKVSEGFRIRFCPSEQELLKAKKFAEDFAENLK